VSLGLYVHGNSPVHRLPPGIKVAALAVFGTIVFIVSDWRLLSGFLAAVLLLYATARIPWRLAVSQVRPAIWVLGLIFVVQVLVDGWMAGVVIVLRFLTLILFASLVTLTTRVSAMIEALESGLRPLSRIGVNPGKLSLALSLALRFIPVIATITRDVREAQRSRGLERNLVALIVPVIIRTLKMAEDIANAIEARSYDPQMHPDVRPDNRPSARTDIPLRDPVEREPLSVGRE
jgi:biotin transport system permease protein